MALITKPDMKFIWASGGAVVKPSDVKIQTGWTPEVPPHQWENWIQNRQDQMLAHINQRGVAAWSADTDYEAGGLSYVQGSDGVVYKSVAASGPSTNTQDPTTDVTNTYWISAFAGADIGQNIAVFSTAGVTNWAVPDVLQSGLRKAHVIVLGGGGGGGGAVSAVARAGAGGGGGTWGAGLVDLTGILTVAVTVGAGGAGGTGTVLGDSGGTSSFGAFISCPGGTPGSGGVNTVSPAVVTQGGSGGLASGADLTVRGGPGLQGLSINDSVRVAGNGGSSLYSSGAGGGSANSSAVSQAGASAGGFGGGGAGGLSSIGTSVLGGAGSGGLVIVRW